MSRHVTIANCLKAAIVTKYTTESHPMVGDVRVEAVAQNSQPTYGVIVSPDADSEPLTGTNERDDIGYVCTIYRCIHSLQNEDLDESTDFREDMRVLFHRKRLVCDGGCYLYSYMDFGPVLIPAEWNRNNNSTSAARIVVIVRESRS